MSSPWSACSESLPARQRSAVLCVRSPFLAASGSYNTLRAAYTKDSPSFGSFDTLNGSVAGTYMSFLGEQLALVLMAL